MPTAWAEAGAAPYNNIVGRDPELVDPENGDYRSLRTTEYGCRVFAASRRVLRDEPVVARPHVVARPGRLDVGGIIDVDTVWDAAEVVVQDDVTVTAGASLTIAAGAEVRFAGFRQLRVEDGDLQAVGTAVHPIVFTSSEPAAWQPDLGREGAWNGLAFVNVPAVRDSSRLRWCVLEYAKALPGDPAVVPAGAGGVLVDGVGGAVRVVGRSPLVLSHCVLRHNLAERGGAVGLHYGARPLLVNNLFHDNHAVLRAGAVSVSYADAVFVHNTFTVNEVTAYSPAVYTGCIDHMFARPWYVGNIIWRNQTTYYDNLQIREAKAYNTRYCDIEDWLGGEGCLSLDPQLVGFAPSVGSPVIDAASGDAAAPWLPALDLAGNPRWVGAAPDMGAMEYAAVTAAPRPDARARLVCYPNPFNPCTEVVFLVPHDGVVRLEAYDGRGRRVAVLADAQIDAGEHRVSWEPRGLASGVYLLRLQCGDELRVQRVTLLK